MRLIELHIKFLLNTEGSVIVPSLGTFFYVTDSFNQIDTVIKYTTQRLVFCESLKHSDGRLSNSIIRQTGYTKEFANQLIIDYVRDIHKKISSGENFDIEGVGTFLVSSNGNLKFFESPKVGLHALGLFPLNLAKDSKTGLNRATKNSNKTNKKDLRSVSNKKRTKFKLNKYIGRIAILILMMLPFSSVLLTDYLQGNLTTEYQIEKHDSVSFPDETEQNLPVSLKTNNTLVNSFDLRV